MNPARTALATLAILAMSMLAAACDNESAAQDRKTSELVARFLPEDPGAAVLLQHPVEGRTGVIDAGEAFWDAVDVGAGPSLLIGVGADVAVFLVFERDAQPGRYNVFVHFPPRAEASVNLGSPIALRNAAGEILAEDPRVVEDGFMLVGRPPSAASPDNQDAAFIRATIGSEWLALSFEGEDGVHELVFRPDIVAEATADALLELWDATDLPPDRTPPILNRPIELSVGDDLFDGTAFWRTRLASVPTLQVGTIIDGVEVFFLINLYYGLVDGGFAVAVSTIRDRERDDTFVPTEFRVGAGEDYFLVSAPTGQANVLAGWTFSIEPISVADYRAFVDADFFEFELEHEGETLVLRLDKSDARGHAIVDAMFGGATEAFEQQERDVAP